MRAMVVIPWCYVMYYLGIYKIVVVDAVTNSIPDAKKQLVMLNKYATPAIIYIYIYKSTLFHLLLLPPPPPPPPSSSPPLLLRPFLRQYSLLSIFSLASLFSSLSANFFLKEA